jgi:hypothetical protein
MWLMMKCENAIDSGLNGTVGQKGILPGGPMSLHPTVIKEEKKLSAFIQIN